MTDVHPAAKTFTVTLGRGARKSTGLERQELTLEALFKRLSEHEVGAKDNSECIVPGDLAPCPEQCRNRAGVNCGGSVLHRLNANMRSMSVLFVDLDKLDAEALMRNVEAVEATGLVFACYSTPSYAPPGKANARFVFPLAEPVPADRWKRIWTQLIAETKLEGADPACCDPSRLYYLPTKPTADAPVFVRQGGTRLLTAVAPTLHLVPPGSAPHEVISALRAYVDYPGDAELVERIAAGKPLADEAGGRHLAILRATMLLARVGARNIDALLPSLNALGEDRDFVPEAERAFASAPPEDPPEVEEYNERQEELRGTDQAFAKRFVRLCGDRARFVVGVGWHVWNGQRWEQQADAPLQLASSLRESYEQDHKALRLRIAELAEQLRQTPSKLMTDKLNKLLDAESKFYKRIIAPTQNAAPASAFLRVAAGMLTVTAEELDADAWVLNCENGTLDLKTGALWPNDPAALCSKIAPVEYDATAAAPLFTRTLEQALPDPEVRAFFQRAIGYGLTGDMSEHLLFLMLGSGGNGKSTLLNAIANALGDYAGPAPKSLLMSSKLGAQSYELADLRGRRMVTVMELSQREYMDSSRLKSVVGGDRIIAARKYENQVTFTTQAKIFMPCNSKPRLNDDDEGAWRRIALIEFPSAFLTDDVRDRALPDLLKAEAPGILAWAVRGCLEWQKCGLRIPDACRDATANYRHEENNVAQFVDDCVERGNGQILSSRLYDVYREWTQGEGVQPMSKRGFGLKLKKLGFEPYRTMQARMWNGVKGIVS
jgi:P4 family phage/plasmid primase-like protien